MSLNRMALRLATVVALTNNDTAPYPTLAEGRVFDSRADRQQLDEDRERLPIVMVYTDMDGGTSSGPNATSFDRSIDLVVEISVCTWSETPLGTEEAPVFGVIETDAEVEAMLDLLEHQVRVALLGAGPWAQLWGGRNGLVRKVTAIASNRFADAGETRLRFAERQIVFAITMPDDCRPGVAVQAPSPAPPVDATPSLPPAIQALVTAVNAANDALVAAGGTPSTYVTALVDLIETAGVPGPAVVPLLKTLRFVEADLGGSLPTPGAHVRPGGVAEITFDNPI